MNNENDDNEVFVGKVPRFIPEKAAEATKENVEPLVDLDSFTLDYLGEDLPSESTEPNVPTLDEESNITEIMEHEKANVSKNDENGISLLDSTADDLLVKDSGENNVDLPNKTTNEILKTFDTLSEDILTEGMTASDLKPTGQVENPVDETEKGMGVTQGAASGKDVFVSPIEVAKESLLKEAQQPEVLPAMQISSETTPSEQAQRNDLADRDKLAAIYEVAKKINDGAVVVDPNQLDLINNFLNRSTAPAYGAAVVGSQPVQSNAFGEGITALGRGVGSAVGGVGTMAGAALKASGDALREASISLKSSPEKRPQIQQTYTASPSVSVLPKLSEYRVTKAEKASNDYANAVEKLWNSGTLPDVKKLIEERAESTGLSFQDVVDKMKPNGEMSDLHDEFVKAMSLSPDAQAHKKTLDKSLESWSKQYARGQEEVLNPETEGNRYTEELHDRLDKTGQKMQVNASNLPAFEDEDKSHAEKLREKIAAIAEKIKEVIANFVSTLRGNTSGDANAPAP